MAVGYPVDKSQVDANAGSLSRQIEVWAPQVLKFKQYLDSAPDADLQAPPFSYTPNEVAVLKSAFNDLALLARIYQGTDVLAQPQDLGVFARRLAGLVL